MPPKGRAKGAGSAPERALAEELRAVPERREEPKDGDGWKAQTDSLIDDISSTLQSGKDNVLSQDTTEALRKLEAFLSLEMAVTDSIVCAVQRKSSALSRVRKEAEALEHPEEDASDAAKDAAELSPEAKAERLGALKKQEDMLVAQIKRRRALLRAVCDEASSAACSIESLGETLGGQRMKDALAQAGDARAVVNEMLRQEVLQEAMDALSEVAAEVVLLKNRVETVRKIEGKDSPAAVALYAEYVAAQERFAEAANKMNETLNSYSTTGCTASGVGVIVVPPSE
jgi:hypothetical protein